MKEGIPHMHSCPKQCNLVFLVSCQAIHAPQQMWMAGHENMHVFAYCKQSNTGWWKDLRTSESYHTVTNSYRTSFE